MCLLNMCLLCLMFTRRVFLGDVCLFCTPPGAIAGPMARTSSQNSRQIPVSLWCIAPPRQVGGAGGAAWWGQVILDGPGFPVLVGLEKQRGDSEVYKH